MGSWGHRVGQDALPRAVYRRRFILSEGSEDAPAEAAAPGAPPAAADPFGSGGGDPFAPADADGQIIGVDVTQPGVINYPYREAGLCGSVTNARFTSTTEVYPDSVEVTPEICNRAQVAAVRAALDHALREMG